MGGSQVMFNTPSAFTKKRKRMVGTNAKSRVEIKQWNPRYPGDGDSYAAANLYSLFNVAYFDPAVVGSSWIPYDIHMPQQGTAASQRIGNTIFLKYLRFKGYLRVYKRLPVGLRWRIRLMRCDNFAFPAVPQGGNAIDRHKAYVTLFHNYMYPDRFDYAGNVRDAERHNFYKLVKKVWDTNIIKSKIIASGYIPPNNYEERSYSTGVIGDNNVIVTTKGKNFVDPDGMYCVPIDVKVKCNDVLKEGDVKYYYVLETDIAIGFNFYLESPGYEEVLTIANTPAEFNFFIRGYFKDL